MTIAIPNEARNNINLRPFGRLNGPTKVKTMVVTKSGRERDSAPKIQLLVGKST